MSKMDCKYCGEVDEHYDEDANISHESSPKHICNQILYRYTNNKTQFMGNRHGVIVLCSAEAMQDCDTKAMKIADSDVSVLRIYAKPNQSVRYNFKITNDMKSEDLLIVGVQLAHPQKQFKLHNDGFQFGGDPHILTKKSSVDSIYVEFKGADIGQYEIPIMFTFHKPSIKKDMIIIREMVVMIQEQIPTNEKFSKNFYKNSYWPKAQTFVPCVSDSITLNEFKVPKLFKVLFPRGIEETALEGLRLPQESLGKLRMLLVQTRALFDDGINKDSYVTYFRHLLWWEEVIASINLRNYNMSGVSLVARRDKYVLNVPGLAENRPSLVRGDRIFLRPEAAENIVFESVVRDLEDENVVLDSLDERFYVHYSKEATFNVRFIMTRVPIERMQEALSRIGNSKHLCRLFPEPVKKIINIEPIERFFNDSVAQNAEQRLAVQHIVSGTSGRAPYMVFGPPGTGKTVTIVEAILQIVHSDPKSRVLVCTHSNMAADHIALMLFNYKKALNVDNLLLRANSQSRVWSVLPPQLAAVSNGTSYESFYPVSNFNMAQYRIVVTTLLHAAKYASEKNQEHYRLVMSHLFVDEAAQASEPATLVPLTGLMAPRAQLVLAGDPQQLGPVCTSRDAKDRGLGVSLMERLRNMYPNLYNSNDPNYITMLVKNFRSSPDILDLPNELFYSKNLQPLAPVDPLSNVSILGDPGCERAIIFHAVNSKEQRMGNAPSYFNEKELDMLKRYITSLVTQHQVEAKDIGVIAPYIRQVYKMKTWLADQNYKDIEVGTVESFQGKEKRVILVSTVRANCKLLDYDAKYSLGFLVDDKRFNVTITRAKAKLIIIGNPACLTRDVKWRKYMELCKSWNCYLGHELQQVERTSNLLQEIARDRFDRCRLTDLLKPKSDKNNNKGEKKK